MSNDDSLVFEPHKSAWISRGFEELAAAVADDPDSTHFDVLIVGSGYGGAIAARTFAGLKDGEDDVRVGVLERGNEYQPGSFPANVTEVPGHVRFARNREGLFDIRPGPEVTTVLANGLGGGSLINAGVMEVPRDDVFASGWPQPLSVAAHWASYFDEARELLGASHGGTHNSIESHPDGVPVKFQRIHDLAESRGEEFHPAAITVAMDDKVNRAGVRLKRCLRCGDCASGCNFGAKESLDLNLLVEAFAKGAKIYTGATVLDISRDSVNDEWIANTVYTHHQLRTRHGKPVRVRARRVVIAAGALGSTEILSRSAAGNGLRFSPRLGWDCSTNGDMLVVDYHTRNSANAIADAADQPSTRSVGPTITGVIDMRERAGLVIEELAVPAALRRVFSELFGTTNALHGLAERDCSTHHDGFPGDDNYAVGTQSIEHSMLYAVMGDDGAGGRMEFLQDGESYDSERDGIGRIRWEGLADQPLFDNQVKAVAQLTAGSGGRKIPNPAWKLLPDEMAFLLGDHRGPVTTVHPLGGCPMGDEVNSGVVDHLGRVFDPEAAGGGHHPGLVVLDGAIIPTALGTNPALTISAVSLRAAEALVGLWGFTDPQNVAAGGPWDRSVFRDTDKPFDPSPTEIQFMERMAGAVEFRTGGGDTRRLVVELTLRFREKAVRELMRPPADGGDATLQVDPDNGDATTRSRIRIYTQADWDDVRMDSPPARVMEARLDAIALYNATLSGNLQIFVRKRSCSWWRLLRAGHAYLFNRGLRDIWQEVFHGDGSGPGFSARLRNGVALATHAGEVRRLVYSLEIGELIASKDDFSLPSSTIRGSKRFTYARRANPWNQLMELKLEKFPGLGCLTRARRLKLDLSYLARIGVPLFRITRQHDGATALSELASFLGYFLRLILGIHVWSFRSPDPELEPRTPDLRPGIVDGLPAPDIHTLQMGNVDGWPVHVRLTRYPRYASSESPILMIHGYSASGTTFAHHAVKPNFASHFWHLGRDVWIVDLRTSPAMDTATYGWTFEDAAYQDIPRAVEYVFQHTNQKIDVVAHCMGAVMFSMAVLHADKPLPDYDFEDARRALPDRVRRLVLTQVGPLVVFSPTNILRAYVVRYLREFLPDSYTFRPGPNPSLADQLLDRLLATLPYPKEEFDKENPVWPWARTEWVRTRHRMDALYGRDFNVNNVPREVLKYIDDLFGALSIDTVTQTIHFARLKTITNASGRNTFVSRDKLDHCWRFPTRSIHGAKNGLSDVSTVYRMKQIFDDAGLSYDFRIIDGAGHQDPFIGNGTPQMLAYVEEFFSGGFNPAPRLPAQTSMVAYPPWIGPIITVEPSGEVSLRIGARPTLDKPEAVILLRVGVVNGQVMSPDGDAFGLDEILANMWIYVSDDLAKHHWDAFPIPPPLLTGAGDGLMALVVYSESAVLQNRSFVMDYRFFRVASINNPVGLPVNELLGWEPGQPADQEKKPSISAADSRRMAEKALKLIHPSAPDSPDGPGNPGPPPVVYPPVGDTPSTSIVSAFSAGPPPPFSPPVDPPSRDRIGKAVEDKVSEMDEELINAVITYRPADNPPLLPDQGGTAFALGSCQYPAGFLDGVPAHASFGRLVRRLDAADGQRIIPKFVILTGDQVYVDATAGLYDPSRRDDAFDRPHQEMLRNHHVRTVLRRVPSFMMLDDHEIEDNWEPIDSPIDDQKNRELRESGKQAYWQYQRGLNFPGATLRYEFTFDAYPFFMLDTRTDRDHRCADTVESGVFIPDAHMGELKVFLGANGGPKFVVSPSILLPRHGRAAQWDRPVSALRSDGWDGYLHSLHEILAHIFDNDIKHVVFLSGDEHRPCYAEITVTRSAANREVRLHSIHTAAAYAPFPFANSLAEDFLAMDDFHFDFGNTAGYQCIVRACFPDKVDGFTYLNPRHEDGKWKLSYQFDQGAEKTITL